MHSADREHCHADSLRCDERWHRQAGLLVQGGTFAVGLSKSAGHVRRFVSLSGRLGSLGSQLKGLSLAGRLSIV